MEKRVQTRHSTGAVRERRVWNFSSRKRQISEEADLDSATKPKKQQLKNSLQDTENALRKSDVDSTKKVKNQQVKKNLQDTEKAFNQHNGVDTDNDSQTNTETVDTVKTRRKCRTERRTQIDFNSSAGSGQSQEDNRTDIKHDVKIVPNEKVNGKETVKARSNKKSVAKTGKTTKRQRPSSLSIPKTECKDEMAGESSKGKAASELHENWLDGDTPSSLTLKEEVSQDCKTQDSLKVVIPVGGDTNLDSKIKDILKNSREKLTKYSLNARHVSVVQGEIIEIDGERLVKLPPSTDDDCIVLISVLGRKKKVDEIIVENNSVEKIVKEEEPCNVDAAISEKNDDSVGTLALNVEPLVETEKHTQTFSDSEQEDCVESAEISEDLNEALVDFSVMEDIIVKKEIVKAGEIPSETDKSTSQESCDNFAEVKEDGTSAHYTGGDVDDKSSPELISTKENVDKQVSQSDVVKIKNALVKSNRRNKNSENPNQQQNGAPKPKIKKRRQDRPHHCHACDKRFNCASDLAVHHRIHTGVKPYSCSVCGKTFAQKGVLINHERIHTGERPFVCDACGKAFCDPSTLRRHARYHTGEKPYKCEFCDKMFTSSSHCKDHMTKHTGEKKFVCHLCGKAFRTSMLFNSHIRVHTGEKKYACKVCDRRFHSTRNRRRHMAVHTGIRKYFMCDICGKNIASSTNFAKHRKIHLTEKPYVCDICDKPFRDRKCFKNHQKAHTERVPHVCPVPECGKPFVKLSHMKRHMLTHKGNPSRYSDKAKARKPFACNYCDKRYKDRQCFKKHYMKHPEAQNVIFKCVVCEKQFTTLAFLEEHVATHENIESNEVVYLTTDDVAKIFSCGICEENFEGIKNFEEHLQLHSDGVALVQSDLIEGGAANVGQAQVQFAVGENMMVIKEEGERRLAGLQQGEQTKFIENTAVTELAGEVDHGLKQAESDTHPEKHTDDEYTLMDDKDEIEDVKAGEEQVKHELNEGGVNVDHPGSALGNFDHLGQVEHIEQVILEDGQSVQTIVYVTVGEEEVVKTVE